MSRREANWPAAVVSHLCKMKVEGYDFDYAWNEAVLIYRPGLGDVTRKDGEAESYAEFFRRVCFEAYVDRTGAEGSGVGPALKRWTTDAVRDLDFSVPARHARLEPLPKAA